MKNKIYVNLFYKNPQITEAFMHCPSCEKTFNAFENGITRQGYAISDKPSFKTASFKCPHCKTIIEGAINEFCYIESLITSDHN